MVIPTALKRSSMVANGVPPSCASLILAKTASMPRVMLIP